MLKMMQKEIPNEPLDIEERAIQVRKRQRQLQAISDTINSLNKKLKEINYYYDVSIDCKIWKDFEKEYKNNNSQIIEVITNITEIVEKLPKNKQEYIYKNYIQ